MARIPAVQETCRIKQGAQVAPVIVDSELLERAETQDLLRPTSKRLPTKIFSDLGKRGARGADAPPFQKHDGMVKVVDAVQGRKATCGKGAIRPEQRKSCREDGRLYGCLAVHQIALIGCQRVFGNQQHVDVTVASAIAAVRQTADEINPDETLLEMTLP